MLQQHRSKLFILALIGLAAALFLFYGPILNSAFDYNAAIFSIFARNHLRYGLAYTHGLNVFGYTSIAPLNPVLYLNHPPALSLFISLFWSVFGQTAWAARLFPVFCAMGTVVMIGLLGRRWLGENYGLLAAMMLFCCPLFLVHGTALNHEAPTAFCCLALIMIWDKVREHARIWHYGAMFLLMLIAGNLGWGFFFLIPFLLGYEWLQAKKINGMMVLLGLGAGVVMTQILLQMVMVDHGAITNLIGAFRNRSVTETNDGGVTFTLPYWVYKQLGTFWLQMGPVLTLLAMVYVMAWIRRLLLKRLTKLDLKLAVLLGWGAAFVLVFSQGSFVHPYYKFYLIPFAVLGSVCGWQTLRHVAESRLSRVKTRSVVYFAFLVACLFGIYNVGQQFLFNQQYWAGAVTFEAIGQTIKQNASENTTICMVGVPNFQTLYYMDRHYTVKTRAEVESNASACPMVFTSEPFSELFTLVKQIDVYRIYRKS